MIRLNLLQKLFKTSRNNFWLVIGMVLVKQIPIHKVYSSRYNRERFKINKDIIILSSKVAADNYHVALLRYRLTK